MNRPRRARSPPFGAYDPRAMSRHELRQIPEYDDPSYPTMGPSFEPKSGSALLEPPFHYQYGPKDQRLSSNYRATLRDPYIMAGSVPYKILCVTNLNPKVSDGPVKDALVCDFSRFGDISVSICHDNGERLAYIYFRTYEEAREARHAKSRTLLFDRPIEIEPIFEPSSSPLDSPSTPQQQLLSSPQHQSQPSQIHSKRRSLTPPEYYSVNEHSRRTQPPISPSPQIMHHRTGSPPLNYPIISSHPSGASPPLAPMPYSRYYIHPSHMGPLSPYSSPPHDQYRTYPPSHPQMMPDAYRYPPSPYGLPGHPLLPMMTRERSIIDSHLARSPQRHEAYPSLDHRHYLVPSAHYPSRTSSLHSSSSYHQNPASQSNVQHQAQSSSRRAAPHPDHPRYMSREFRREKYGSENYSNEPEEGRPSRVLFVTNIDSTKTSTELRAVFSPFGIIEELELRKVSPDNSSALIKYSSMDCAYKAKTATNGKYIGSLKCRITYSRVSASRRLWIGGLGSSTTVSFLEEEFGRFGDIVNMDYTSGRPYAYVEFETTNQAQFATHHLRGTMALDAERRLRIEYVDPVTAVERNDKSSKAETNSQTTDTGSRSRTVNELWNDRNHSPRISSLKRSITPTDLNHKRTPQPPNSSTVPDHRGSMLASGAKGLIRSTSNSPNETKSTGERSELNNNQSTIELDEESVLDEIARNPDVALETPDISRLVSSRNIKDVVECCPTFWCSLLVLRNFNFPSKLFMCSGRKATIEKYLKNGDSKDGQQIPILPITQRWRLHPQPKLEEVKRRMQSGNLGMLIITSRSDQPSILSSPSNKEMTKDAANQGLKENGDTQEPIDNDQTKTSESNESTMTQSRPLKNLISYLEQKDAAGVISLSGSGRDQDGIKLLYAFPPGDFALNLLRRQVPNLLPESTKEEFLLGVIVGGTDAKI